MNVLFTVGAKLLGVYFVYLGLVYLVTAAALAEGDPQSLMVQLLLAAATGLFAVLLLFRTESVGRMLGVREGAPRGSGAVARREAVQVGIVLIGIFVLLTRLSSFLLILSAQLRGVRFGGAGGVTLRILIESVPLALALYAVLRADRIADRLTADRWSSPEAGVHP